MDRQFPRPPFFDPFFNPFFSPFVFPRRRFFPFFFLSPFFFPFFRGEEDRDGTYSYQHQCREGDTMETLAQRYNVPQPILEAMNQQIQDPNVLAPGSIAYIPRMDKMYCHKMYLEQDEAGSGSAVSQQMMPQSGMPYQANIGQQATTPYTGTNYPAYPGQQATTSHSGTNYPAYPGQQTTPMF